MRSLTLGVRANVALDAVMPCTMRRERARQVDPEQDQVEAVDAQHVDPLVAAVAQVAGLSHEVGQRDEAEQRADQRGAEREREQDQQAGRAPADGGHVVPPQEQLGEPDPVALLLAQPRHPVQLGQDQQAAVGPAAPLDAQRAEVRRGGAVAEPLRVVVQPPAVQPHVDRGLGVLDGRAVLDVLLDLVVADVGRLGDLVERLLADDRVRADPERGVVVGQALVHDVLQVGGRAGDPLQPGGGAGERAVRRLRDGDVLVLLLLEQVHQPQAVLGQQHAVGVQRHHVVRVGDVRPGTGLGAHQRRAAGHLRLAEVAAHQPDVAVEVHRLVGLMGQRHVLLALEAGDPDGERPHEPPVQPQEHLRVQHDALASRVEQRRPHLAERLRQLEQDLVDEEGVGVVDDLLVGGEVLEPLDRVGVGAGHRQHRGVAGDLAAAQRYLQRRHPAGEPAGRLGEDPLDLGGQRPGVLELLAGLSVLWHVRVVDQEHNRLVRVLLERSRQQRGHDDPLFLLVGGDDRGQRRALGVEVLVQAAAGGPVVRARPVEEPEPAQQVRHRGRGQQRDDQQVQDLFRPGYRALVAGVEEVGEEPVDRVGDPRRHGDDDGEPAHRDPAVADRLGDHRQRLGAPVVPKLLAALGRRLLLLLPLRGVAAVPARAGPGLLPGLPVPPVVAVAAVPAVTAVVAVLAAVTLVAVAALPVGVAAVAVTAGKAVRA